MTWAVEVQQVTKIFGNDVALDNVSLRVGNGSVHGIVGPNGAGKSTLLKAMIGLLAPTAGQVRVLGEIPQSVHTLRQRVHYISPEIHFYPMFRVDNILKYVSLLYERWDDKRCEKLIDGLRLPKEKTVRQLLLGMKMRLRLAIAFAAQADVLLLDEATNGIDPVTKEQVLDLLLQEVANRNVSVVLATHNLPEVERVADTVSVLVDGKVLATQNLDEIGEQYHEVNVVLPKEQNWVMERLNAVDAEVVGNHASLLCPGDEGSIKRMLEQSDVGYWDVRPASMERWFRLVLKKGDVLNDLEIRSSPVIRKIIVMVLIALIVRFLLPLPKETSENFSIDNTIWIGVLTFEGTTALGYIAITPWLAKISISGTLAMFTGGIRSGVVKLKTGAENLTPEDFEANIKNEINDREIAQIIARSTAYGGFLLMFTILIMGAGIWLTPHWKAAVLCASIYWVTNLLWNFIFPAVLAYIDLLFGFYERLKVEHENIRDACIICQRNEVSGASSNKTMQKGNSGIGKWFVRTIWFVAWIVFMRNPTDAFVFYNWRWIWLFVPIYISILLVLFKLIQSLIRRQR